MTGVIETGKQGQEVRFESWNPYVPRDMAGDARRAPLDACATLFLPDGEAPPDGWPAVVVVQGLGGPKAHRELAYGGWLAERGYAALVLDVFRSRGIRGGDVLRALRVTTAMILADAFGGLRYLAGRPDIDGRRIAIKGYSYGGMVAMMTAYEPIRALYLPQGGRFAGHVNYYGCSVPRMETPSATGAPVLIMLGSRDRNVSVPRTRAIAEDLERAGADVDLKVFDCYHQWDGADVEPRRDIFHLRHCQIAVAQDGTLSDAKTGRRIDGPLSRFLFLARHASPTGYTIKQDTRVLAESNAALLAFLGRMAATGGGEPPR